MSLTILCPDSRRSAAKRASRIRRPAGVGGVVTDVTTPRQTVREAASRRSEDDTGEGNRKLRNVSPPRSGDLHARIGATSGHSLHSTVARVQPHAPVEYSQLRYRAAGTMVIPRRLDRWCQVVAMLAIRGRGEASSLQSCMRSWRRVRAVPASLDGLES